MREYLNCEVIFDSLVAHGYQGSRTTLRMFVAEHRYLVPVARKSVEVTGRARRYRSEPGKAFEMDWGFVTAVDSSGRTARLACFAMVCHHCGSCWVEFFVNARQESLFVGMVHAFFVLGVPDWVLTDNMKSVVASRDMSGAPAWNSEYAAFMDDIGFTTRLCKVRHPFTKGKVERLIRYVKDNFLAARSFSDLSDLNEQALAWSMAQARRYRRGLGFVPAERHEQACMGHMVRLEPCESVDRWLFVPRKVSFDGFVCFEGKRWGVPGWHADSWCRIGREGPLVRIFNVDMTRQVAVHQIDWTTSEFRAAGQWASEPEKPEEVPTGPVTHSIRHHAGRANTLTRFNFESRNS